MENEVLESAEDTEEIISIDENEKLEESNDTSVNDNLEESDNTSVNDNSEESNSSDTSSIINYNIETIDYTEQLETLTTHVEYLTNTNQQILISLHFMISIFISIFVCFILYKFLKIFF